MASAHGNSDGKGPDPPAPAPLDQQNKYNPYEAVLHHFLEQQLQSKGPNAAVTNAAVVKQEENCLTGGKQTPGTDSEMVFTPAARSLGHQALRKSTTSGGRESFDKDGCPDDVKYKVMPSQKSGARLQGFQRSAVQPASDSTLPMSNTGPSSPAVGETGKQLLSPCDVATHIESMHVTDSVHVSMEHDAYPQPSQAQLAAMDSFQSPQSGGNGDDTSPHSEHNISGVEIITETLEDKVLPMTKESDWALSTPSKPPHKVSAQIKSQHPHVPSADQSREGTTIRGGIGDDPKKNDLAPHAQKAVKPLPEVAAVKQETPDWPKNVLPHLRHLYKPKVGDQKKTATAPKSKKMEKETVSPSNKQHPSPVSEDQLQGEHDPTPESHKTSAWPASPKAKEWVVFDGRTAQASGEQLRSDVILPHLKKKDPVSHEAEAPVQQVPPKATNKKSLDAASNVSVPDSASLNPKSNVTKYIGATRQDGDVWRWAQKHLPGPDDPPCILNVDNAEYAAGNGMVDGSATLQPGTDPKDHETKASTTMLSRMRKQQTAEKMVAEFLEQMKVINNGEDDLANLSREERRERRQAQRQDAEDRLNAPIPVSPHAPEANIYMRPAEPKDAPAIAEIHDHYVVNTLSTPCADPLNAAYFHATILECRKHSHPFVVAVFSSEGTDRRHQSPEEQESRIAGFAYTQDYGSDDNGFRCTADLNLFVHPQHVRKGVGKTLMDRILFTTSMNYHSIWKDPVPFHLKKSEDNTVWKGGAKQPRIILMTTFHPHGQIESCQWLIDWLKTFKFVPVSVIPYVTHERGRWGDMLQLYYEARSY